MTTKVLALAVSVLLMVIVMPSSAYASPPTYSGSFRIVDPSTQGTSSYTVDWSYPATVVAGQVLNVSATLYLDGLTGLKLFVDTYLVSSFVDLPGAGFVAQGNVTSLFGCGRPGGCGSPRIYPGGHWGPEIISLKIRNPASGVAAGGANASVSVGFVTSVWYDAPVSQDYQDTGSQVVGNVTIMPAAGGISGSLVPFAGFVAFGGIMGPVVLYIFTRVSGRPKSHLAG